MSLQQGYLYVYPISLLLLHDTCPDTVVNSVAVYVTPVIVTCSGPGSLIGLDTWHIIQLYVWTSYVWHIQTRITLMS